MRRSSWLMMLAAVTALATASDAFAQRGGRGGRGGGGDGNRGGYRGGGGRNDGWRNNNWGGSYNNNWGGNNWGSYGYGNNFGGRYYGDGVRGYYNDGNFGISIGLGNRPYYNRYYGDRIYSRGYYRGGVYVPYTGNDVTVERAYVSPDYTGTANTEDAALVNSTAMLGILMPTADAELWFEGVKSDDKGLEREFRTPKIEPNKDYSYDLKARWMENGKEMERVRHVTFRAGEAVMVDFRKSNTPVAPRTDMEPRMDERQTQDKEARSDSTMRNLDRERVSNEPPPRPESPRNSTDPSR